MATVQPNELRAFTRAVFVAAGTSAADAATMAALLVEQDMAQKDGHPGSHGTRCMTNFSSEVGEGWQNYVRSMLPPSPGRPWYGSGAAGAGTGRINPRPAVAVTSDSPCARVYDGDGGLGHIVCKKATEWAIAAAKQYGTAAATTRNHFHVGATGFYPRIAARQGCICICVSSHRWMVPKPGADQPKSIDDYQLNPVWSRDATDIRGAVLSSPMSIGIPAGPNMPPVVLDGATGFASSPDHLPSILKELGLQAAVVALGGVVAGVYQPEVLPGTSEWESNQGAMIIVLDATKFLPKDEYGKNMDAFVSQAMGLPPIAHADSRFPSPMARAELPGADQARRIAHCEEHGIDVEPKHLASLVELADELGISAPADWRLAKL